MANIDEINKAFIDKKVNPILEKLVLELLLKKPDSVCDFIMDWVKTQGRVIEKEILEKKGDGKDRNAYGESSSDENEDEIEDLEETKRKLIKTEHGKPSRNSVSAEAYGLWNKKADFKPKIVKKTEDQNNRLREKVTQAFMFSALDEKELQIVLDAFEEKKFPAGTTIIKQGDDGDNLYVIDEGSLDCFKRFSADEDPRYLKTYEPGEAFGELALLYNAPRAATIVSKNDCVLFALDRETFNYIVKDAAAKKREKYENFLKSVELLDTMDPYERSKIADALKAVSFAKGDYVVKEGEFGDNFFLLEEGEAIATKTLTLGKQPETVYTYKPGDYFGELALLRDTARAANIVANTDIKLVTLDRLSFKRMMGPLEDLLKRNFVRYEKFMQ